jgi:uncharacterized protein YprB with RNaseH-like and TPR domain
MSGRSFRDRYAALSPAQVEHSVVSAEDDWPVPRGARKSVTPDGTAVIHDAVVSGAPVTAAQAAFAACHQRHGGRYAGPADLLFLDTETTGLAGGTGTHVFLVGVGRFTGDAFHVRQFFMRHPGDERALLSALDAELRHAAAVVTYNGRAFDLPLLETRYRMHGRALRRPEQHIDVLAAARAIWKHRLPNCALGTLERMVLDVRREADAPGWMIPQLYFDYLHSRRIDILEPVFEHNRYDIVSLARLAALVQSYEARLAHPADAIDRLGVALLCLRRHASPEAIADLRDLWPRHVIPATLRLRALRDLSVTLKRQRRFEEAVAEWQRALGDQSRSIRLYACEELAKYLEHRVRDHAAAREMARLGTDGALLARDDAALDSFTRRVQRLDQKLQRTGAGQSTSMEGS